MAASGKWIDGIGPQSSVEDAARRSLEPRLATVAHNLPLAAHLAEHDIEHVHRLRVATRRAAAALKLYRDWLPRKSHRWVKKRLRKIRRAASDARDLDVLVDRLQSEPGAGAHDFVKWLTEQRAAVQPGIVALAEDLRREDCFVRKSAGLVQKIRSPHEGNGCTDSTSFGDWAPRQLARIASEFFDAWPDDSNDIERLHSFRIRAKALRYAIELLYPAFEPHLRGETYPIIEELQERLGHITDHNAAIRLISEWQSGGHEGVSPEDAAALIEMEKAQQIDHLHEFQQWWTPDRADGLKRTLFELSIGTSSDSASTPQSSPQTSAN